MSIPVIVDEVDGGPAAKTFPRTGPLVVDWIAEVPEAVVMRIPPAGDTTASVEAWESLTARGFRDRVRTLAQGLIGLGLERGDRLSIMCHTRPEWSLLSWACAYAGIVVVPIYETSSPAQVEWNLTNAGVVLMVVEDATLRAASGVDELAECVRPDILVIEEGALDQIEQAAVSVDEARLDARAASVKESDLITIIYTSGTTGRPKGCAISHGGFLQGIDGPLSILGEAISRGDAPITVLLLPLAHIFGRVMEATTLLSRHVLVHEPDAAHLAAALTMHRPTYRVGAPGLGEGVRERVGQRPGEGRARRKGLRCRRRDRRRVGPVRLPRSGSAGAAHALRPTRLPQAARRSRRSLPHHHLRRQRAERTPQRFLPGRRPRSHRGLRPHRGRGDVYQPPPAELGPAPLAYPFPARAWPSTTLARSLSAPTPG